MNIKRKIMQALLGMFFVAPATLMAADDVQTTRQALVLKFADSTTASFILADKPVVGFADGRLTVKSDVAAADYNQKDVAEFYFDYVVPTSIASTDAAKHITFCYDGGDIINVYSDSPIDASVYTADGKLVAQNKTKAGTAEVNIGGCKPGMYLLSVGGSHTIKIFKKQ